VAAANAAAGLTRNEVLIILGDDQLASPDLVAAHLAVHAQRGPVLVQGEYPLAPGHDRSGASLVYERSRSRSMAALVRANKSVWHLWGGNFSLRRSTWVEIGGFDGSFGEYGAEDTDVALRVAALGIPLVFEPRALTHHLHVVNPRQYARQAFSEGRAVVRLARKHGLPLDGFPGSTIRRPIDRLFAFGWRRRPALMWRLGGVVAAGLAGADRLAIKKMQIAVARALRRFHRVGGITIELTAAGPPAPGHP
jgi:GT2 family glycosyltransferase